MTRLIWTVPLILACGSRSTDVGAEAEGPSVTTRADEPGAGSGDKIGKTVPAAGQAPAVGSAPNTPTSAEGPTSAESPSTAPSTGEAPSTGPVPRLLKKLLVGRDRSPLPPDAILRYLYIGLTPDISKNHRFVLYGDGRLHVAWNTRDQPADREQRFNTPLPEQPTATLSTENVARVKSVLRSTGFASSSPFVGNERVRDGGVVIITARVDGRIHEVWFQNVSTELSDLLDSLIQ